jgi:hypothetical protein
MIRSPKLCYVPPISVPDCRSIPPPFPPPPRCCMPDVKYPDLILDDPVKQAIWVAHQSRHMDMPRDGAISLLGSDRQASGRRRVTADLHGMLSRK